MLVRRSGWLARAPPGVCARPAFAARMVAMRKFRPLHGILLVAALLVAYLGLDSVLGRHGRDFVRVSPAASGQVDIPVGDLKPDQVRFYRFLNAGNQEVKFFVGRDEAGGIQVAFDAAETDYKRRRGFRSDGAWMVNNKCDTAIRLVEVNDGRGGCAPIPLRHRLVGDELILAENDILEGWRYFR